MRPRPPGSSPPGPRSCPLRPGPAAARRTALRPRKRRSGPNRSGRRPRNPGACAPERAGHGRRAGRNPRNPGAGNVAGSGTPPGTGSMRRGTTLPPLGGAGRRGTVPGAEERIAKRRGGYWPARTWREGWSGQAFWAVSGLGVLSRLDAPWPCLGPMHSARPRFLPLPGSVPGTPRSGRSGFPQSACLPIGTQEIRRRT